jgi:hypothetical protein
VTYILKPGKASEKTPKGVIPPSLCEISQNTKRKKKQKKRHQAASAMAASLFPSVAFVHQWMTEY